MTRVTADQHRAEYIKGLRMLADALESNPDVMLPYSGSAASALLVIPLKPDLQREQLRAWARMLPGTRQKKERDATLDLIGSFAGIHIQVICDRAEVCEKVVVGTREVTVEIPDPTVVVPKVTVTKTVEDVEWRCGPLLAELSTAAEVAEAALIS